MEIGSDIEKEGWLHKRGEHIKTWRARYFILIRSGKFLGFNSKPVLNDEPNNIFFIKDCQIVTTHKTKVNTFILKFSNGEKVIERFFAAYDLVERDQWIQAIHNVTKILNGKFTIENLMPKLITQSLDDFEYLRIIGKGHYGKVVLVREKKSNFVYAMKILKKNLIIEQNKIEHIKTEKHVLKTLKHPFITSLVYSFQTKDLLCLVMEYVCGGDLFFHLTREGKFTEEKSKFYTAEICFAIGYLHENGIIYRDLKLENVLLDSFGHIKLADFGLCKMNMYRESKTKTFCGTIEYLAPEVLKNNGYTCAVDWWALGIVLYEMLTGNLPFTCKIGHSQNQSGLFGKILNESFYIPKDLQPETRLIISNFLEKDPVKRLGSKCGFEEVKNHKFFNEINWDKLMNKEIEVPFKPRLTNEADTCYFDKEFTGQSVNLSPPEDTFMTNYNYFESFSYYGSKTSLFSRASRTSSIKSKEKFDLSLIDEEIVEDRHKKVYYFESNEVNSFEDFLTQINQKRDNLSSASVVSSSSRSHQSSVSYRSVFSFEMVDL